METINTTVEVEIEVEGEVHIGDQPFFKAGPEDDPGGVDSLSFFLVKPNRLRRIEISDYLTSDQKEELARELYRESIVKIIGA